MSLSRYDSRLNTGLPKNLISKRPYQSINLLLLNSLSYEQNLFLTWKQLKIFGGSVKKGEKGTIVVFNKIIESQTENNREIKVEKKFFLRYYKVFNVSQCTDIPSAFIPVKAKRENKPLNVNKLSNRWLIVNQFHMKRMKHIMCLHWIILICNLSPHLHEYFLFVTGCQNSRTIEHPIIH